MYLDKKTYTHWKVGFKIGQILLQTKIRACIDRLLNNFYLCLCLWKHVVLTYLLYVKDSVMIYCRMCAVFELA